MEKKRFTIKTLGCRTNQYESEAYRAQLEEMGYEEAKEGEKADLCIVNTCTVTESADQKSRYQIRQLARENGGAEVFVTGCLAERAKKELETIEGVTKVVPNLEKEALLEHIFPGLDTYPEFRINQFEAHTRAFLKVQDGCNSYCSYCIIPYVRGRSRSRTVSEIVEEAKVLISNGYKEIVLTGINIGDFDGGDGTKRLSDLVKEVDALPGLLRLRISSIDPDEVDQDLIDAVVMGAHTCPSMHVVLQSGSNTVLKRMNRKYTKQDFISAIERLKKADPLFTFTTDVIVGFPGESDEDFRDTLAMIREVRFAKVHMFPYSKRPKTKAARFTDTVSHEVMDARRNEVMRFSEQMAYEMREEFIGKEMDVLLERSNQGFSFGHTSNFLEVKIENHELRPNEMVRVKCIRNTEAGLVGELV